MKKFLVTLLAAAVFGGAFAQSSFPDIPENHWAGEAVDRIADLGIVIGFPDGTFRGNEAFTRYQSALVVSRMLDVIGDELDARQILTNADLAALRNAVQELAGDLAAHELDAGASMAAISDNVAANTARLDDLESRIAEGPQALRDLENQVAAQRVAIDTAQAQAEAAAALAQDAMDAALNAANRAAQNADAIEALTWLTQDLNDRLMELERPADLGLDGLAARVGRTESDIANIREFVILLRRDQIAMRDQVAALEDTSAQHGADIADLQDRVSSLEEDRITISGSIVVDYRVDRLSGADTPFDVDRAFGLGQRRDSGASIFTSGPRTNGPSAQRPAQYWVDIDPANNQGVAATLNLTLDFAKTADSAAGSPRALNNFESILKLELKRAYNVDSKADGSAQFDEAYVFSVKEFKSTFEALGGAPITFDFGEEISSSFTPYIYKLDEDPGFVATVSNPVGFLDFINPELTVAYSGDPAAGEFSRGLRLTLEPLDGVLVGGSFAQHAANASENADANNDNVETTVWGVDASAAIGIFELSAEYANSDAPADSILFVEAGVATDAIEFLGDLSLNANYRDIAESWNGLADDDDYPYEEDQVGFGIDAAFSLFIVDVGAYFDSYEVKSLSADVSAFGVNLDATIFRGLGVTGFFNSVSVNGDIVDSAKEPYNEFETAMAGVDGNGDAERTDRDTNHITGFGVGIKHDGESEDALVAGLNLSAEYKQLEADFTRTVIDVSADYDLDIAFLNFTPYAQFVSESSPVGNNPRKDNLSTIRAGTGIETEELDFFLKPSLDAAVNFRSTDHTQVSGGGPDYTATEFQFSVGVKLNEFLFDNSTLTARYGSWSGENVRASLVNGGSDRQGVKAASQFNADADGVNQSVSGYELLWDYWDLQFSYGAYLSNDGTADTAGQAFRIKYTVSF